MTAADLFGALGMIPALPGARCRGRHHLFDARPPDDPEADNAQAHALALCARCPALTRCAEWFDALSPRQRPPGVVAGQVNRPHKPRRTTAGCESPSAQLVDADRGEQRRRQEK